MRARIIEAAKEILGRDGYEKASIREIANEAGVARGLVHYYFETKEDLLAAVAERAAGDLGERMAKLREGTPASAIGGAAFDVHRERVASDPTWYRLRYDLFALALRKPAFREQVAGLLRGARAGIQAGMARIGGERGEQGGERGEQGERGGERGEQGERGAAQNEALAAILAACFDGLALQKLVDPTFDLDGAYQELHRVAALALGLGR